MADRSPRSIAVPPTVLLVPTPTPRSAVAATPVDAVAVTSIQAKTLAVDIGGTGLKAAVLDHAGAMVSERVRVDTTYPAPPDKLVADLVALVKALPAYDRVSVGFPGVVRDGFVLSAPHFVTSKGPGSKIDPKLVKAWARFDLAGTLATAFGKQTRIANDADLQGCAVVTGKGLELVITLGTGCGTAVFRNGHSSIHLELAHHPFRNGQTYNEQLGEMARKKIPSKRWNMRVQKAIATLDALFLPDHIFVGGGNAARLKFPLPANVSVIDNAAGILGGIKLWESDTLG